MKTVIIVLTALSLGAVPVAAEGLTIDDLIVDETGADTAEWDAASDPLEADAGATTEPVAEELQQPVQATQGACTAEQNRHLRELGREYALSLVRNDFLGGREIESLVETCTFD